MGVTQEGGLPLSGVRADNWIESLYTIDNRPVGA